MGLPAFLSPPPQIKSSLKTDSWPPTSQDENAGCCSPHPQKKASLEKKQEQALDHATKDTMPKLLLGKLIKTEATTVQSQHLGPNQEKGAGREKEPGGLTPFKNQLPTGIMLRAH